MIFRVVYRAGQLIAGRIVLAPDQKIAQILASHKVLRAKLLIHEFNGHAIGDAKAPIGRFQSQPARRRPRQLG